MTDPPMSALVWCQCLYVDPPTSSRSSFCTFSLGRRLMVLSGRRTRRTLRDLMVLMSLPLVPLHGCRAVSVQWQRGGGSVALLLSGSNLLMFVGFCYRLITEPHLSLFFNCNMFAVGSVLWFYLVLFTYNNLFFQKCHNLCIFQMFFVFFVDYNSVLLCFFIQLFYNCHFLIFFYFFILLHLLCYCLFPFLLFLTLHFLFLCYFFSFPNLFLFVFKCRCHKLDQIKLFISSSQEKVTYFQQNQSNIPKCNFGK